MGLSAGTAFVDIQPNVGAGFQGAIAGGLGKGGAAKGLGAIGLTAGGVIGAGVVAGVGAAVGGAVLLKNVGETFDAAFDTIRVGTGKVGADLDVLKEDFKAVFAEVPTDADSAARAIADLNSRTGATGETLQGLAATSLELSRITGEDVGQVIQSTTRLFGDWGVAIEDGSGAMDGLFRASQATGAPVSQLSDLLVQYGAPLRQFGFGMEESAALLGKFEKEGVNTKLVMGSLRVALGKIAREGGDPAVALTETVDAIKNAGSVGEANALALETFGARAGPDMAAAIREGRFELGELLAQVQGGGETILGAAADTADWGESWQKIKNQVFVAIEPLATRFLDALSRLFAFIADKTGPVLDAFGKAFGFIGDLFRGVGDAASGAEGSVGGAFSGISDIVAKAAEIIGLVVEHFRKLFEGLQVFWKHWGGTITGILKNVFGVIVDVIGGAFDVIAGIFDVVLGILTGDWSRAWEGLKRIVEGIWRAILGILRGIINNVRTIAGDIAAKFGDTIRRGFDNVVDFVKRFPGRIFAFLVSLPARFVNLGADIIKGILKGLGNIAKLLTDKLKAGISAAIDKVKNFFGIGSPSKVMAEELGLPLAEGVALGAEATGPMTAEVLTAGIDEAAAGAKAAILTTAGQLGTLKVSGIPARVGAQLADGNPAEGPDLPPIYADVYIDGIGKIAEGVRIWDRTWGGHG